MPRKVLASERALSIDEASDTTEASTSVSPCFIVRSFAAGYPCPRLQVNKKAAVVQRPAM